MKTIGEILKSKTTEVASKGEKRSLGDKECMECGVVVQDFVQECVAPDFNLWYPYFPVCDPCLQKLENGVDDDKPDPVLKLESSFVDICPPEMRETDASRLSQKVLNKIINEPLNKKGLLIHGDTGTGKTRMMWLLVRELIVARGKTVRVYNAYDMKEAMLEAYKQNYSKQDMMSGLLSCDVLCIDDLGKEKMTDAWKEMLFSIIDKRTLYHKPMVITTNYTGKSFASLFSDKNMADPAIRRLRDFFVDIST